WQAAVSKRFLREGHRVLDQWGRVVNSNGWVTVAGHAKKTRDKNMQIYSTSVFTRRAASFFVVVVRRYQVLSGEVNDQASAWVDFVKNANLCGPWGGCHREWRCLDDADVVVEGMQRLFKGVGHRLLLSNRHLCLGSCCCR
uniref:Uncharacterized protein n=1 Tax=Romanomermis culicivorax TaxID=13658 RepID=A0A915KHP1_ROMCU